MTYVIITIDRSLDSPTRFALRDRHIAHLKGYQEFMLAAGEFSDDDGNGVFGDVLLIDTEDRAVAERIAQEDPFMAGDLFQWNLVFRWTPAFLDGKCLLPDQ